MAYIIKLKSHIDKRGCLTAIEKEIPFEIKRVFYLYNLNKNSRGGHRHHSLTEAIVCLNGSFRITITTKQKKKEYLLDNPKTCLITAPKDFRVLHSFSQDCIILVLASSLYNKDDYIRNNYK